MNFPVARCLLPLVENEAFIKLLDKFSFNLAHALLAFRRLQDVDWFESSSLG